LTAMLTSAGLSHRGAGAEGEKEGAGAVGEKEPCRFFERVRDERCRITVELRRAHTTPTPGY